ncbi:hypothetical protein GCM10022261_05090 [Brevibacterium daeguense]|uniref:Uncharacterized protein n=1 Tax=Brevibacterium daeguense TaxID=909936 RepID=A0ABP8EG84_9MICO|nr:hypothetical protein [Brevibacterium daeguense]
MNNSPAARAIRRTTFGVLAVAALLSGGLTAGLAATTGGTGTSFDDDAAESAPAPGAESASDHGSQSRAESSGSDEDHGTERYDDHEHGSDEEYESDHSQDSARSHSDVERPEDAGTSGRASTHTPGTTTDTAPRSTHRAPVTSSSGS